MILLPQQHNANPDWYSSTHRVVQTGSVVLSSVCSQKCPGSCRRSKDINVDVLSKWWLSCCLNLKGNI